MIDGRVVDVRTLLSDLCHIDSLSCNTTVVIAQGSIVAQEGVLGSHWVVLNCVLQSVYLCAPVERMSCCNICKADSVGKSQEIDPDSSLSACCSVE